MAQAPAELGRHLLIVIPNWVGDVVMASPALAAIRARFSDIRISLLLKRYVAQVLDGCDWYDQLVYWSDRKGLARERENLATMRGLRSEQPDTVLLLTNSFRAALYTRLAGIRRRVGFARDGRGWLLTQRLKPLRAGGKYVPRSVVDSYCDLAEAIGAPVEDRRLRLAVSAAQEQEAMEIRRAHGIEPGQPYAVANPGAAFGAAKCWLPERFAAVCHELKQQHGLSTLVVGAPGERELMHWIAGESQGAAVACENPGTTLGSLKPIIRDAAALVCNDTGPRHYGLAFRTPTVTIFGPTHQAWTTSDAPREVRLQADVPCGPCQLRTCPLDHACMQQITVAQVLTTFERMLQPPAAGVGQHG